MAEVLIEHGIGATRALVIDSGTAVEAHFERDDSGPRAGSIAVARLTSILAPGRRGIVALAGVEALLEPLPRLPEGALLRIEITREAIPEIGRPRLAKARAIEGAAAPEGFFKPGPDLAQRLAARGLNLTRLAPGGEDRLEAMGWSELIDQAQTGHVPFAGGLLTISPTPAMTVIDIDGPGAPETLAEAAAGAVAAAVRRFDIQGSIGVDFPTLEGKPARARLGELLDMQLPAPFERTAVNGFGFAQIVRPRARPSLLEQVRAPGFAALELLRRASRAAPGARTLVAPPVLIAWLAARPDLVEALGRQLGGDVSLQADATLAISASHVV